jgi:hypothetical protein
VDFDTGTEQRWLRETWNLLRHDGYPVLMALNSRWAYTDDGFELSRSAKILNAFYRVTCWLRWPWWRVMLERPAPGLDYRTVVFCRIRGHAPRIYYNPGGMEPDDRCSRCLEEY